MLGIEPGGVDQVVGLEYSRTQLRAQTTNATGVLILLLLGTPHRQTTRLLRLFRRLVVLRMRRERKRMPAGSSEQFVAKWASREPAISLVEASRGGARLEGIDGARAS